jgi:hypothetical protein
MATRQNAILLLFHSEHGITFLPPGNTRRHISLVWCGMVWASGGTRTKVLVPHLFPALPSSNLSQTALGRFPRPFLSGLPFRDLDHR